MNMFRSSSSNYAPMFAMKPVIAKHIFVSLLDVQEAYELTRPVKCPREKEAIYACFGLDMQSVEKLFPDVFHLEKCWQLPSYGIEETRPFWKRFIDDSLLF